MERAESTTPTRPVITFDDLSVKRTLPDGTTDVLFKPTLAQAPYLLACDPNLFLWGNRGGGKGSSKDEVFEARIAAPNVF